MTEGLEAAFERKHIEHDTFIYNPKDFNYDEAFFDRAKKEVSKKNYAAVFSINFSPVMAKVCKELNVPYISWIYDSPVNVHDMSTMTYDTNVIYTFDRGELPYWEQYGIKANHLPLAADVNQMSAKIKAGNSRKKLFTTDISFAGRLYKSEYASLMSPFPTELNNLCDRIIKAQLLTGGEYIIPKLLTDGLIEEMNKVYLKVSDGRTSYNRRQLEFLFGQEATARERLIVLGILSKHFKLDLYSGDSDDILAGANMKGYINYDNDLPLLYSQSKINLNIALKPIKTGIPLRVLDCMACGGFMMSNYKAELAEYFEPGEEIAIYSQMEEAVEYAAYYLEHDSERKKIAEKGRAAIEKKFNFDDKINVLFNNI